MKRLGKTVACLILAAPASIWAQSLPVMQDSFVAAGSPMNYGSLPTINVGGVSQYQGLVQFDLSMLPAGTTGSSVAKATLSLYVNKIGTAGAINIDVANFGWTELGVSGTNSPTIGALVQAAVPVTAANTYLVVDATQAVKNWLDGITPNHGFIVSAATPGVSVYFDSKENTSTSHPASLDIVLRGPAGPSGAQGPAGPAGARGLTGATGPQGPSGPAGAQGATGANGPASLAGMVVSVHTTYTSEPLVHNTIQQTCPNSHPHIVSGGCGAPNFNRPDGGLRVSYSGPLPGNANLNTWYCSYSNPVTVDVTVVALCSSEEVER